MQQKLASFTAVSGGERLNDEKYSVNYMFCGQ